MINLIMQKIDIIQISKIRFKTSVLRSDLCDYSDASIVVKGNITVTNPDNDAYDKKLAFKNNALTAFQKLIPHLLIMQKIWIL